ncbi:MAG: glutamine-dependent synthetase, partial [Candidatus Parcubacteria bacterium]
MKTKLLENGITVALAQMPVVAGNPRANADWMITEISKAISRSVDIIVFPELAVPGYVIGDMPEDESFVRDVWGQNWRVRNATAATSIVVIFGSYGVFSDPSTVGEDGRIRKVNAGFVVQN